MTGGPWQLGKHQAEHERLGIYPREYLFPVDALTINYTYFVYSLLVAERDPSRAVTLSTSWPPAVPFFIGRDNAVKAVILELLNNSANTAADQVHIGIYNTDTLELVHEQFFDITPGSDGMLYLQLSPNPKIIGSNFVAVIIRGWDSVNQQAVPISLCGAKSGGPWPGINGFVYSAVAEKNMDYSTATPLANWGGTNPNMKPTLPTLYAYPFADRSPFNAALEIK